MSLCLWPMFSRRDQGLYRSMMEFKEVVCVMGNEDSIFWRQEIDHVSPYPSRACTMHRRMRSQDFAWDHKSWCHMLPGPQRGLLCLHVLLLWVTTGHWYTAACKMPFCDGIWVKGNFEVGCFSRTNCSKRYPVSGGETITLKRPNQSITVRWIDTTCSIST